jgi:hypothetical protein
MAAAADELRHELRELCARHARGDIRPRDFERRQADGSVALGRAVAAERLVEGETVLAEHHLVHSHFKLTQSMLQEPEQATVSLFATQHRLIRMRGSFAAGRPVSCDDDDGTVLDELPYAAVAVLVRRTERRWGEVAVGAAAAVLALALGNVLAVTGPMLVVLGLAGVGHGLLLPTRSVELVTDRPAEPPFVILGLRRKSARALLAILRQALATPDRRLAPTAARPHR